MVPFDHLISLAHCECRALCVPPHDQEIDMARAIGCWGFCAHNYSDDQLVHAAFLMLQHALAMPELDNWRLPAGKALVMNMQCKQGARTRDLTFMIQMS